MWEAAKVLTIIVFLGLCCIQDIREEKLSLKMLIASGILFFMLSFIIFITHKAVPSIVFNATFPLKPSQTTTS